MRPRVLVVTTGGTIAMAKTEAGIKPSVNGRALLNAVPGVEGIDVDLYEFSNVPSDWIEWEEWILLSRYINERLLHYDGVVIVQGTDTIEESAYFFNLTVSSSKPVVVTGAMRSSDVWDTDGPRNLRDSIMVAGNLNAVSKGVVVVVGGEIHAARDVFKIDRQFTNAFSSGRKGAVGIVDELGVVFFRSPEKRHTYRSEFAPFVGDVLPQVDVVYTYTGMNLDVFNFLVKDGSSGIVVVAAGIGNASKHLYKVLKGVVSKVPVVITSRAFYGRVAPLYGYEGGGKSLYDIGCVMGEDLHPLKARILLSLLLRHGKSLSEIRKGFKEY